MKLEHGQKLKIVSDKRLPWPWLHFQGLQTLVNLGQVSVIRSVSLHAHAHVQASNKFLQSVMVPN
jgi:hypothetical protein